jgi:FKBP-type peptidyl-prolyl cis-trans isomerase FkpA
MNRMIAGLLPVAGRDSVKLRRVFRSVAWFAAIVAVAALGSSCDSYPLQPSSPDYSQQDLRVGTGAEAISGSVMTVSYTGWLYDISKTDKKGVVFDTTVGKDPLTFTLGIGAVVRGWEEGLVGMKVGGVRRLILPPSFAYGSARYSTIPPNSTLIFDIELLSIEP